MPYAQVDLLDLLETFVRRSAHGLQRFSCNASLGAWKACARGREGWIGCQHRVGEGAELRNNSARLAWLLVGEGA